MIRPPEMRLLCRVSEICRVTHDIRVVRLALPPDARFDFLAGQYARVDFTGRDERDYSIASRPGEAFLEFHVRDMGGGPSRYVASTLEIGDLVAVRGPYGDTFLRPERTGPIVAIAGGSGLGQMKAIVEEALARGLRQPIHLYFGCRAERDLYLEEHLHGLAERCANLRFVPVLSEPETHAPDHRTGLVTDALAADSPDLEDAVAYLAGPPPMVESARRILLDLGVRATDIHADAFIGEAERRRAESGR